MQAQSWVGMEQGINLERDRGGSKCDQNAMYEILKN